MPKAGWERTTNGARNPARLFSDFAGRIAHLSGRPVAFVFCCLIVAAWAVSGPLFGFSDTWQLVINTGTTIITFLMVFLIQNTQNRDGAAIQAKLDELIRASSAQNSFIGIDHLTADEVEEFRRRCEARADEEGRNLHPHEKAEVAADFHKERAKRRAP